MPAYDETWNIADGLQCFICEAPRLMHSWRQYADHIRHLHRATFPSTRWKHTKFYQLCREDTNAHVREKKRNVNAAAGWREVRCMLLYDNAGRPVEPYQMRDIAPLAKRSRQLAIADAPSDPAFALARPKAKAASDGNIIEALALPAVAVKEVYFTYYKSYEDLPPTAVVGHRSPWPGGKADVDLKEYEDHLQFTLFKKPKSDDFKNLVLYIRRFFHMIEINGRGVTRADNPYDVKVFVQCYFSNIVTRIFALPMMKVVTTYNVKMVSGLRVFIKYLLSRLERDVLTADGASQRPFVGPLRRILETIDEGVKKEVGKAVNVRVKLRQQYDRTRINELPTIEDMKNAVRNAMCVLLQLRRLYAQGSHPVDEGVHYAATVCVIGIIALNTYLGRKREWEHLERDHYLTEIRMNHDWFSTSMHKTFQTYGTLGKWMPPGTRKAMEAYDAFYRDVWHTKYFFNPPNYTGRPINLPTILRAFSNTFFQPSAKDKKPQRLQVNLLRKFFHTELVESDEEKLMNLLKAADPHATLTMRKHYILTGPEHHAKMARRLYTAVMGEPIEWPDENDGQPLESKIVGVQGATKAKILSLVHSEDMAALVQTLNEDDDDEGDCVCVGSSSIGIVIARLAQACWSSRCQLGSSLASGIDVAMYGLELLPGVFFYSEGMHVRSIVAILVRARRRVLSWYRLGPGVRLMRSALIVWLERVGCCHLGSSLTSKFVVGSCVLGLMTAVIVVACQVSACSEHRCHFGSSMSSG